MFIDVDIVPAQIMQLLGHAGLRQLLAQHGSDGTGIAIDAADDDDDDAEDGYGGLGARRKRRRPKRGKNELPPIPSIQGRALMDDGTFGAREYYRDTLRKRRTSLAGKLMSRETGVGGVPSKMPTKALSQVGTLSIRLDKPAMQLIFSGHDPIIKCGHNHSLQLTMLFRTILR